MYLDVLFDVVYSIIFIAYLKRVISHPSFKNVTFKDAEKLLDTMEQGDCVVRPSSKVKHFNYTLFYVFNMDHPSTKKELLFCCGCG